MAPGRAMPANPHPHGKVPALINDGETVFESSAIALYLTDKYRTKKLGPAVGEPKRGEYLILVGLPPGRHGTGHPFAPLRYQACVRRHGLGTRR